MEESTTAARMDWKYAHSAIQIASLNNRRIVGFEVVTAVVMHVAILWDTAPCSPLNCWFSTLKMEVIRFSETSVHIWTTRRHIPEDCNIQHKNRWVLRPLVAWLEHTLINHGKITEDMAWGNVCFKWRRMCEVSVSLLHAAQERVQLAFVNAMLLRACA
jgi:hypothetical protein